MGIFQLLQSLSGNNIKIQETRANDNKLFFFTKNDFPLAN